MPPTLIFRSQKSLSSIFPFAPVPQFPIIITSYTVAFIYDLHQRLFLHSVSFSEVVHQLLAVTRVNARLRTLPLRDAPLLLNPNCAWGMGGVHADGVMVTDITFNFIDMRA